MFLVLIYGIFTQFIKQNDSVVVGMYDFDKHLVKAVCKICRYTKYIFEKKFVKEK